MAIPTVAYATKPGQALFIDIVNNPSKRGLTPSSYYSDYLIVTDYYSHYSTFIGLQGTKTYNIILALEEFEANHKPFPG